MKLRCMGNTAQRPQCMSPLPTAGAPLRRTAPASLRRCSCNLNQAALDGRRQDRWLLHPKIRTRRTACAASAAASANGSGAGGGGDGGVGSQVLSFLDANFIPVALLSAIAFGWLFPGPGVAAAAANLQVASTCGIFVVSGILLQRGEAVAALRSPLALAFGLLSILILTPALAPAALAAPLRPPEMALGLAVFCCVPTTLSTCVTLTLACGGNAAVALLLVVASNVLGVVTIPAALALVLGAGAGAASFQPAALFRSLVATVLLPLMAGVALQVIVPGLSAWRARNRKLLSYISTLFLCSVPWMQLSVASRANLPLTPAAVAAAAAAGAALHLAMLAFNTLAAGALRFNADPAQDVAIRRAVILCTSQKTLPVAVAVVSQLSSVAGAAAGLAAVPCVLAHLLQITIDSALVARWNRQSAAEAAAKLANA